MKRDKSTIIRMIKRTDIINVEMRKIVSDHISNRYTNVYSEASFTNNAPHNYVVTDLFENVLADIHFQEGPIKEAGINGICNEDLIAMVIDRLEHFQDSEFKCDENTDAIKCLYNALKILRQRTDKRIEKGIEGTHIV